MSRGSNRVPYSYSYPLFVNPARRGASCPYRQQHSRLFIFPYSFPPVPFAGVIDQNERPLRLGRSFRPDNMTRRLFNVSLHMSVVIVSYSAPFNIPFMFPIVRLTRVPRSRAYRTPKPAGLLFTIKNHTLHQSHTS
jgi:hypothetical protein